MMKHIKLFERFSKDRLASRLSSKMDRPVSTYSTIEFKDGDIDLKNAIYADNPVGVYFACVNMHPYQGDEPSSWKSARYIVEIKDDLMRLIGFIPDGEAKVVSLTKGFINGVKGLISGVGRPTDDIDDIINQIEDLYNSYKK